MQETVPAIEHPVATAIEPVVPEIENSMPIADVALTMEEHGEVIEKPNVMNVCCIDEDDDDELYDDIEEELEDEHEDEE